MNRFIASLSSGAFSALVVATLMASAPAWAQRDSTVQAFERMTETLEPMIEEGQLAPGGIGPVLLVGATPAFEETRAWFPSATLVAVVAAFGGANVRACEACMNPRVHVEDGRLEHNTVLSLPDIARLDAELRGNSPAARSAMWVEETPGGISVRIIGIDNGRILYAGNFDGGQRERIRTADLYNQTLELGRRLRGESLTHVFIDVGMVPGQHITMEFAEQFGPYNNNMVGIVASAVDPVFGLGITYYRVIPLLFDFTIGVQGILSLPTAGLNVLDSLGGGTGGQQLIDPLVTGVVVARFPIPSTNFALLGTASTNLSFSVGFTLLNFSILPFVP